MAAAGQFGLFLLLLIELTCIGSATGCSLAEFIDPEQNKNYASKIYFRAPNTDVDHNPRALLCLKYLSELFDFPAALL